MPKIDKTLEKMRELDVDRNLKLDGEELRQIDNWENIDQNNDGVIDIGEWLEFKGEKTFTGIYRYIDPSGRWDNRHAAMLDKAGLHDDYEQVKFLISLVYYNSFCFYEPALTEAISRYAHFVSAISFVGLNPTDIAEMFLDNPRLSHDSGLDNFMKTRNRCYRIIMDANTVEDISVDDLYREGLINGYTVSEINRLVEKLTETYGDIRRGSLLADIVKRTPAMLSCGIKDIDHLFEIIKITVEHWGGTKNSALEFLPKLMERISTLKEPEYLNFYFEKIISAGGEENLYRICNALEKLFDAGVFDLDLLVTYFSATKDAIPPDGQGNPSFRVLHKLVRGGYKDRIGIRQILKIYATTEYGSSGLIGDTARRLRDRGFKDQLSYEYYWDLIRRHPLKGRALEYLNGLSFLINDMNIEIQANEFKGTIGEILKTEYAQLPMNREIMRMGIYVYNNLLSEQLSEKEIKEMFESGELVHFMMFLGNSYKDLKSEDYSARELLELTRKVRQEHNIHFYGRLSVKVLEALLNPPSDRPLAIIVLPVTDHNGAFNQYNAMYIEELIANGYRIKIVETHNGEDDIYEVIRNQEEGTVSALFLNGHGTYDSSQLTNGTSEKARIGLEDEEDWKKLKKFFAPNADIVFYSCNTGSHLVDKMAEWLSLADLRSMGPRKSPYDIRISINADHRIEAEYLFPESAWKGWKKAHVAYANKH